MWWESLIAEATTSAGIAAVVIFLGRKLVTQAMSRDLERFKADLEAEAASRSHERNVEIERLRATMNMFAIRLEARVGPLHEERARAISKVYSDVLELSRYVNDLINEMDSSGQDSRSLDQDVYGEAILRITEFRRRYEERRLYLTDNIDRLIAKLRLSYVTAIAKVDEAKRTRNRASIEMLAEHIGSGHSDGAQSDIAGAFSKAEALTREGLKLVDLDAQSVIEALTKEFRKSLGAELLDSGRTDGAANG